MASAADRVVVLVDMDCFYVQVEQREKPELKGKPCAVVQYNQWKGGAIIAVGYEARARGVTRGMRGDEARERCPGIELCSVPAVREKADLTRYRDAGAEVIRVLSQFANVVERASIDEAYLDITDQIESLDKATPDLLPNTFVVGRDSDPVEQWLPDVVASSPHASRLVRGAVLVERMRRAVLEDTGFHCSAGISHNKALAKFACTMHKPNRQTILPIEAVDELFNNLSVKKIRNLGGKLGTSIVEDLGINTMGELRDRVTEAQLCDHYGEKTGRWLFKLARGHDSEPVKGRQLAKSVGCSKTFPGVNALDTCAKVRHWLEQLTEEVVERLVRDREQNRREARGLSLYVQHQSHPRPVSFTRACALTRYDPKKMVADAMVLLRPFNTAPHGGEIWSPAITCLGLSAGKFIQLDQASGSIRQMFSSAAANTSSSWAPDNNALSASSTNTAGTTTQVEAADFESLRHQAKRKSSFFERLCLRKTKRRSPSEAEGSSEHSVPAVVAVEAEDAPVETRPPTADSASEPERPKERLSFFERLALRQTPAVAKERSEMTDAVDKGKAVCKSSSSSIEPHSLSRSSVSSREERLPDCSTAAVREGLEKPQNRQPTPDEMQSETEQPKERLSFFERFARQQTSAPAKNEKETVKKEEVDEEVTFNSQTDFMECQECHQRVLMFDMPEHRDFHVAQQVHRELQADLRLEASQQQRPCLVKTTAKRRGRPSGPTRPSSRKTGGRPASGCVALDKFLR